MSDYWKLLLLCLTIVVTRSLCAPLSDRTNIRHEDDGTTARPQLSDAINLHPQGDEKTDKWDAFRRKNDIDSDSRHYGRGTQGVENIDQPPQGNQKSHQIFHQGINLDVSNMLDDLEAMVVRLYRKIYGNPSAEKWHNSRQLVGDSRHRVSTIVGELMTIFPQVQVRQKRSVLNQSEIAEGDMPNGTFYFSRETSNFNESDDQTFEDTVEPLQFWFNLGSDVADYWRSSMYSLTRRILETNITGDYLNTLNEYLEPFKVHIGTRDQYKKSNSTPAVNTTHRQFISRRKRYVGGDFSNHRFGRLNDFKDRDSLGNLLSSSRQVERRLYYSDDDQEYISPDRDDGYGGHDSYGHGGGYAKLDPYVVLGALAACAFIGAMALSLYCKMEGSPCCDNTDGGETTDPPTTVTGLFDEGDTRTDNPFFFELPPGKKKYNLPWVQ